MTAMEKYGLIFGEYTSLSVDDLEEYLRFNLRDLILHRAYDVDIDITGQYATIYSKVSFRRGFYFKIDECEYYRLSRGRYHCIVVYDYEHSSAYTVYYRTPHKSEFDIWADYNENWTQKKQRKGYRYKK